MDLEEARNKSKITQEERDAIAVKGEEFATVKPKTIEDLTAVESAFSTSYDKLKEEASNYEQQASILGISFNMTLESTGISNGLANISFNIEEIKRQIEEKGANPFETSKDAISAANFTTHYGQRAEAVKEDVLALYDISRQYAEEATFELKKGVDGRVQDVIKRTKLRLIAMKKQELQGKKISWLGRLRGLDKLRDIELENLNLEEQLIANTPIQQKGSYSIVDSLAELKAFSARELNKQNTQEMDDILTATGQIFSVDERTLSAKVNQKLNSNLMVLDPKRRVSTATKIHKAEEKRQGLKATIRENEIYGYSNGVAPSKKGNALTKFEQVIALAVRDLDVDVPEDRRREFDTIISPANRITEPINTDAVRQAIRREQKQDDGWEH